MVSVMATVGSQLVREGNEGTAILSWRLQLLGNVGGLLTDGVDVVSIQGEPANLDGASGQRHETKDGAQKGGLAATALTCDADKLATVHLQIEATKESLVAKGERSGAEGNQ